MLTELSISGLGVIDLASLEPHAGFTVVTGETGAGKTMIVTALGLVTGGRADSSRVRTGSPRAVVEARIQVDPQSSAAAVVRSVGGELDDDDTVIVVRTVGADGRSRAHVGGRGAPVAALSELTDELIAIHGQSEAISLLRPAEQRAVLDRYAGLGPLVATYREQRDAWRSLAAELTARVGHARERAQREQMLRLGLAEIEAVAPLPGEDAELIATVRRLENADALREAAQGSLSALSGADTLSDEPTAIGLVEAARRLLVGSDDPRLAGWDEPLHQASVVLGDVAADLAGYLDALDADPARLEETLARQSVLRGLTRRYGADADAILAWADDARRELADLDTSEEALAALRARREMAAAQLAATAAALSERRSAAAVTLSAAATAELAHLAMGRAELAVAVARTAGDPTVGDTVQVDGRWCVAGAEGIDQVEILLTAHAGAPPLPIARGASGGELSRVMLALEVVLSDADPVSTLVFDEVDAGVGGRAATEIGRRLALLAGTHQVIVVTHLAQVAAFADRQFVVDSSADGAVRAASVREVSGEDRRVELARMLGGTDGPTALAHAADLLAAASSASR